MFIMPRFREEDDQRYGKKDLKSDWVIHEAAFLEKHLTLDGEDWKMFELKVQGNDMANMGLQEIHQGWIKEEQEDEEEE